MESVSIRQEQLEFLLQPVPVAGPEHTSTRSERRRGLMMMSAVHGWYNHIMCCFVC
jgi:hypothetical protein